MQAQPPAVNLEPGRGARPSRWPDSQASIAWLGKRPSHPSHPERVKTGPYHFVARLLVTLTSFGCAARRSERKIRVFSVNHQKTVPTTICTPGIGVFVKGNAPIFLESCY